MVSKKSLIVVSIAILVLIVFGIFIFSQKKPKIPPKEEVKKEEKIEEVLEQLTPKEQKPLTEKEKKEIEKVLETLTPK